MNDTGISPLELQRIINMGLTEDIGTGDITSERLIPAGQYGRARLLAKAPGIVAGIEVAGAVFRYLDASVEFTVQKPDGSVIEPGDQLAVVAGPARVLLSAERLALNLLQHMSGIATQAHQLCALIEGQKAVLVDTRKTTPGLRSLEKYAVRVGGAHNHRFALYDGAMIKDNHIHAAGGIIPAVRRLRAALPHTMRIEVEVENLEQLEEALIAGADIIMLDNMAVPVMAEAVQRVQGQALLEASGGITALNLAAVAATGVDYISMGALTHSAPNLDISLKFMD